MADEHLAPFGAGQINCVVQKFKEPLPRIDVNKIYPCIPCNNIAFLSKNGGLIIIDIAHDNTSERTTVQDVCSFSWQKETKDQDQYLDQPTFCVVDKDCALSTYTLTKSHLQLVNKYSSKVVQDAFKDKDISSSSLEVLSFHGNLVCLSAGHIIVTLLLNNDMLEVQSTIDVGEPGHAGSSAKSVCRVEGETLVAFEQSNSKLFCYSIKSGLLQAWLDVSTALSYAEDICAWAVSDDINHFSVIYKSATLVHIALPLFITKNPHCLKTLSHQEKTCIPGDGSSVSTLSTGTGAYEVTLLGDSTWKRQLGDMLKLGDEPGRRPWYTYGTGGVINESSRSTKVRDENKRRQGITGFKKNTASKDKGTDIGVVKEIPVPEESNESSCEMMLSCDTVYYKFKTGDHQNLCVVDVTQGRVTAQKFNVGEDLVLSPDPGYPHLLLTNQTVATTGLQTNQEQFVSRIMLYGGASTADVLCHLNKWDRCTIPIHTLEIGLKHRQLDTVSFFLKSKEKLFSNNRHKKVESPSVGTDLFSWVPSYSHEENFRQVEPGVDLLVRTVKENVGDPQSRQFTEQLLSVTLNHLYGLQADALSVAQGLWLVSSQSEDEQNEVKILDVIVDKLMRKIGELRQFLKVLVNKPVVSQRVFVEESGHDEMLILGESQWDDLDTEAVIESGLVSNKVLQVQQYLWQRGQRQSVGHANFVHMALRRALTYLAACQFTSAEKIISSLGLNIGAKLWEFLLYSKDPVQREFILEKLEDMATLADNQQSIIRFYHLLYRAYPCHSFTEAKTRKDSEEQSFWAEVGGLENCLPRRTHNLSAECGDILPRHSSGGEGGGQDDGDYCQVLVDWLQHWDDRRKARILLDSHTGVGEEVDEHVTWSYHQSHNDWRLILHWLDISLQKQGPSATPPARPGLPPLSTDTMEGGVHHCTSYIKDMVADKCAKHGVFVNPGELSFSEILRYLGRIGAVMVSSAHPLQDNKYLGLEQFHEQFIDYCVQETLPSVLWDYLDHCHIDPAVYMQSKGGNLTQNKYWLPMLTYFYAVSKNPACASHLAKASLTNAGYVLNVETSSGQVEDLFIRNHSLAALATALYTPLGVDTVVSRNKLLGKVIPSDVENKLRDYPKLHQALFPTSVSELERTDVTVYQLLQKNAPFCPSGLFGWQSTNTLASEDCMKELPYFSHPELVSKYAPIVRLKFTYYLRQGRPSFAYVSFLAQELDSGVTVVSTKRVAYACRVATGIGLKQFTNTQIVSGCAAFVEMLGEDSVSIRTHIQTANTILTHRNSLIVGGSSETKREIMKRNEEETIQLVLSCVRSHRKFGREVLKELEEATKGKISRDKLPSFSFQAASQWNLVILFCYQVHLPYSTCFLQTCAKENQWLPFIWFSQLHQYPKEQLHGLLHLFKLRPLREHLHYVIENAQAKSLELSRKAAVNSQPSSRFRDIRSSLYTRIGLAKGKDEAREQDSSNSEDEDSKIVREDEDEDHLTEDELFSFSPEAAPDDVFGVVFAAVASRCPWQSLLAHSVILRNPLFAVLAASFKGSSTLACLSSWLVAMMDASSCADFTGQHGVTVTKWTLVELRMIVDVFVQKNWTSTLATAYDIFQMQSPLLSFFLFLAEFMEKRQYKTSKKRLETFKEAMHTFRQLERKAQDSPHTDSIVGNIEWFEQVSYSAICHQLTRGDNLYETCQFLSILEQVNVAPVFNFTIPDYSRLSKLLQIALDTRLDLACALLLESSSIEYRMACEQAMTELQSRGLYSKARELAQIAGLTHDHITISQVKAELAEVRSGSLWKSPSARLQLWLGWLNLLKHNTVQSATIAEFFEKEANESPVDKREVAYLYQLSHDCLCEEDLLDQSERRDELYIKLWRCRIQAKLEDIEGIPMDSGIEEEIFTFEKAPKPATPEWKKELVQFGIMPHQSQESHGGTQQISLSELEEKALDEILGELLDSGQIRESCKLTTVFNHYSKHLAIILSCMRLATGAVTVENLDPDIQKLLFQPVSSPSRNRRQSLASQRTCSVSSSSLTGVDVNSPVVDVIAREREETVSSMEKLLNHCNQGVLCCLRIITAFKISMVLDMDYDEVVASDDFTVLNKLLTRRHPLRFTLAKDYLQTGNVTDAEVAGFLSDAIVLSLQVCSNLGDNGALSSRELIFNPADGTTVFSQLVRLCTDPSILGNRLLDAVASLATEATDASQAALSIQTELLVLAHECHTVACNMEGISNILRAARVLTECLTRAEEFSLMIRLLTGVGRYCEMSYIFDAMKQNHQFELLLRKGMEKESKLKVAMLDYLKRFHSTDSDSYTMVALKFTMYREIAHMLEECAYRHLSMLKNRPLDNSSETKGTLTKVVQYFSDAADSYIKENCMRHGQACVKQAQLVALQIHHLSSGIQLINLTPTSAAAFIIQHPRFTEAFIVSEAYSRKVDWPAALCCNFLINGDSKYFTEFKNYVKLTPSLISETMDRYEQEANKSTQSVDNVKVLLSECPDVKVKYRLAKDLGLQDIVTQMENGESGAYLLDVFI